MATRIAYIDAMRGFTMFLVVYNHVLLCAFGGGSDWSVNDIFLTFRMPLFFFLSGFLMYKKGLFTTKGALGRFLQKKVKVQLLPTLIFSLIYVLVFSVSYKTLFLDKAKCGYWFTYTLFFYFAIYAIGDYVMGRFVKGKPKILIGTCIALMIYALSKYALSPSCPWFSKPINGILGLANFQYFIFFYLGSLVRAYFTAVERVLERESVVAGILIGFVLLQLALQLPSSKEWIITVGSYSVYSLLRTFSGFLGIAVILIFFRKNEGSLTQSRIGRSLRYIGVRTLDIYLIHLLLIHTDMSFIGHFLAKHSSFISEMALGGAVSIAVIGLCLVVSEMIRCSDTLAKLLFGKVIKE